MSTFVRPFTLAACGALAAALLVAWPARGHAQPPDDAAASSASASGPRANRSQQKDDDDNLPAATRRARADERRLLGAPRATLDPYENDDPSPKAQEDALMNEQRMTIVSPSEFYSSGSPAMGGGQGGGASAGGSSIKQRLARTSSSPSSSSSDNATAAPKRYDYSAGGLSAPVYRNPYETQNTTTGQPYRSPW
jgi:hypothetical protein